MARHWYRNDDLNINKLFDDKDLIPIGFSRSSYSNYQSTLQSGENNPNWGKPKSEETKRKISDGNKGKIVSEETRLKQSISAKNRDWSNFHPNHKGKNNPNYGKKRKMSESTKKQFLQKRYNTMKQNNSFNISKPEEDYYEYLLTIYDKEDIIRQYRDDRYPFDCDFYIKLEDKFIECHFSWIHGFKPYNPDDECCQELLTKWESKTNGNDYYSQAIYVWTDLDVRKVDIANKNNLNIEFIYSIN